MRRTFPALLLLLVIGCSTAQPRGNPDLLGAVKADNAQEVEKLLASGVDANAGSPLQEAAAAGAVKSAEVLLAHGADPKALDNSGFAPLHYAAYNGQPEVVALLIRSGADVNARSKWEWTALDKALEPLAFQAPSAAPVESLVARANATVGLLLSSGAEVNLVSNGMLPIHFAALTGQKSLVQQLLDKGADVNAKGRDGVTPLYLAAKKDCAEAAEFLIIRGAALNAATKTGYTPLHIAASEGSAGVAKVLLEHGADANAKDGKGHSPLYWAGKGLAARYTLESSSPASALARKKAGRTWVAETRKSLKFSKAQHGEVALLLVNHGADHSIVIDGNTPLYVAALVGDQTLAQALIAAGADLNAREEGAGETPLHAAIAEGHVALARLLVGKGADVNAENGSKRTPLHSLASFLHDKELGELLIQHGANVNAKDKAEWTPLAFAVRAKNEPVAELLRQHGAILTPGEYENSLRTSEDISADAVRSAEAPRGRSEIGDLTSISADLDNPVNRVFVLQDFQFASPNAVVASALRRNDPLIAVELDGAKIAELHAGEVAAIPTAAGTHLLKVTFKGTGGWSLNQPQRSFDLEEGGARYFRVYLKVGSLLNKLEIEELTAPEWMARAESPS